MLLSTVKRLRERLNVRDTPQYNTALGDLLVSCSLAIESHLDTPLERITYEDLFYADPSNYRVTGASGQDVSRHYRHSVFHRMPRHGTLYLRLKSINVSDIEVTIRSGYALEGLGATGTVPAPDTAYKLQEKNGLLAMLDQWYADDYITVKYTAGYEAVEEDGYLVYQNVPKDLETACLIFAEYVYFKKYGDDDADTEADAGEDYTDPPNSVLGILGRYDRYAQHALRPVV